MRLTLRLTLIVSRTKMQLVFYSRCNIGAPVWSAKDSIYLGMALVFLKALYMHIISPSVDSEDTAG